MANDNKRKLYDALSQDYDMGTYEQFCADLNDEGKRRKLYDATSQDYDFGTWDSFSQQLGYGQEAKPAPASTSATAAAPEEPKTTEYFRLRRGGKDFTVPTREVNAYGGLSGWAQANPGAPVRVYMDADGVTKHVALEQAHDRSKRLGYKYSTTTEPIATKPWKPSEQEKIRMSANVMRMNESIEALTKEWSNQREYMRKHRPGSWQPVEGEPTLNAETGKMEKTYITSDGTRTTNKALAQADAIASYNEYANIPDMTISGQIRQAQADKAALQKKANERFRAIADEKNKYRKEHPVLSALNDAANSLDLGADGGSEYRDALLKDTAYQQYMAAISECDERIQTLKNKKYKDAGGDVGFWRTFGQTISNPDIWFGHRQLLNAGAKHTASNNKQLDSSQALMGATAKNEAVQAEYGDFGFFSNAGAMTGEMLPFMLDFALTGNAFEGINVFGKLASKGAVKAFGEAAVKEMAETGIKTYIKKYGVNGVGRLAGDWSIKALGTTGDDLLIRAPLLTNTIQAPETAADVIDRKLGDVKIDENGNYDFTNDKTWGSAIWQGEANAIIENYSEMFGTHLDGVVPTLAKTFGGKRISGMLARANASSYGQILDTTRKQFERLGVSDYFGEVSEEYYGQLWRTMLNLDDAYEKGPDGKRGENLFFSSKFHGDIWGGMALSMGLIGGAKYSIAGIGYADMKHQVNKADKTAAQVFGKDNWEPLRQTIDRTDNESMGALAEKIVTDTSLSAQERGAAMEYMERSMNFRGMNLGALARSRGDADEDSVLDSELSRSYLNGYSAATPTELNDVQNMYEQQRLRLVGELGSGQIDDNIIEAQIADIENDPISALNKTEDMDFRDVLLDYINAKTVRDGMLQSVRDGIDERVAEANTMIDGRVNRSTGVIQPAVVGVDNREAYIVSGNVAVNADGTIDPAGSDETIIVRDEATETLGFISPKDIVSLGEAVDADAAKAAAAIAIRGEGAQAAADAMNGTLAFNPGDVITIDGNGTQVTVIGPAVDAETGAAVGNQVVVQLADGNQSVYTKEELQGWSDAVNRGRAEAYERERAERRGVAPASAGERGEEALRPGFALNDEFTILNDTGAPIRGSVTGEIDEDGMVEVYTEEPVNGNRVNRFSPAELEGMLETYNGEAVGAVDVEQTIEPADAGRDGGAVQGEGVYNPATPVEDVQDMEDVEGTAAPDGELTALSRIPVDEEGQPMYDEADPETAWDAIVEQAQGDESIASEVVADIVADREEEFNAAEKAYNKTKEGKPEKRKKGDPAPTMTERIAAKNAAKEALAEAKAIRDAAKATLEHWKKVAGTMQRREGERRAAEEAEARRRAQERAEEEARLKAEREEAERIEREALNGVPDWNIDTPADARARGYRRNGPQKVDRPEIIDNMALGNTVGVKFGDNVMPTGNVVVIEASQLQPSHRDGERNPAHFLDEAQPKERKDAVSRFAAARIAETMRPEEITSSVTAYTGAPSINARGEVIQGNNRSEALRIMYERFAQSADRYRQYLIDHAAEYGLTPEAIAAFEQPVLVNMLDVPDGEAITLGQYVAQDTESGGIERIKPKNAVKKMGDRIRTFANLLLRSSDDEATFAQLVDANGLEVLKWMNERGYITNTQYASAFDSRGNLSAEAANDLRGIMYQSIFTGGSTRLEEMFNKMPAKAQRAILATAFRDYDSPFAERMLGEIQQSIIAFNSLMGYEQFRDATNAEAATLAVEAWKRQTAFDDVTGEPYLPSETFSNFALALAAMYKGNTQKHIQSVFNTMYDIVQGTEEDNLFETADKTPKPLAEAIRRALNIEYKPISKPTSDNGSDGSPVLDINSENGEGGGRGSGGNPDGAEQAESEAEPTDSGAGAAGDSGQGGELAKPSFMDAVKALYERGREFASSLFQRKYFDVVETPDFMKALGLRGDKFTIRFGVISRHFGKDSDHNLPIEVWEQLPQALQKPFAITKHFERKGEKAAEKGYRIYTTLRYNDKYVIVGADVKIAGRGIEINAIETAFAITSPSELEEVIYTSDEITPDQQSLLDGRNSRQYTADKELSGDKDSVLSSEKQGDGEKSSDGEASGGSSLPSREALAGMSYEEVAQAAADYDAAIEERYAAMTEPLRVERSMLENKRRTPAEGKRMKAIDSEIAELERRQEEERLQVGRYFAEELRRRWKSGEHAMTPEELEQELFMGEAEAQKSETAAKIAAAEAEVNTEPTPGQKEAGNYKKGHVQIDGLKITIENPKGSVRRGTDADGKSWETEMKNTYGYILGTTGKDGDKIDVFLSDNPEEGDVYVVDQYNKGEDGSEGSFDEHKVMYGFADAESARAAYLSNYSEEWADGRKIVVTGVTREEFKKWLDASDRKTKPFAEYKSVKRLEEAGAGVNERIDAYTEHLAELLAVPEDGVTEEMEDAVAAEGETLRGELEAYYREQGMDEGAAREAARDMLMQVRSQTSEAVARKGRESEDVLGEETGTKVPAQSKGVETEDVPTDGEEGEDYIEIPSELQDALNGKAAGEDGRHGYKVGDVVLWNGEVSTINGFDEKGRPMFDPLGGHEALVTGEWREVKPVEKPEENGEEPDMHTDRARWMKYHEDIAKWLYVQTGLRQGQKWVGADGTSVIIGFHGNVKGPDGWRFETTVFYPDGRVESLMTPAARIAEFFKEKGYTLEGGEKPAPAKADGPKRKVAARKEKPATREDKGAAGASDKGARIEDFGEKIEGARKDMLKDVARSIENVTEQSLIELPLSKAFKRPNLKKLTDAGVISDEEAVLAEAIMQGLVYGKKKPVLTRRPSSRRELASWATETYKGIRLLGEILSGDESRKAAALEARQAELAERLRAENAHIAKLREWNPGREFADLESVPDAVEVIRRVLEDTGYKAGDKIELPLTRVEISPSGNGCSVSAPGKQGAFWFKTYHDSVDGAIKTMTLAAKLARGDMDAELPSRQFGVRGVGNQRLEPTGRHVAQWLGGKHEYDIKEKVFDSKEAAEEFVKDKGGRTVEQMRATGEYDSYAVQARNPLTGKAHTVKDGFASRAEASAWLDGNGEEANTAALEAIYKEMGKKGAVRPHFYVSSSYNRRRGKMIFSVVADDKSNPWPILKDFDSRSDAEGWLKDNLERLEGERRKRKEAERAIVYYNGAGVRTGEDYRGGEDATAESFTEAFGFRGVQFGNWTNDADRQAALNQAYDALMDLAHLLGVPARALSLDGELGLAFGARGGGRAAAHYEPVEVVINLTKTQGAGALAHEWWHALDNFLSRRAGVALGYASHGNGTDKMSAPVREAVGELMPIIGKTNYAKRSRDKGDYWGRGTEVMARLFESWAAWKLGKEGRHSPFLSPGINPKAEELYRKLNYFAYRADERRRAELEGRAPNVMSEEEFKNKPESLNGYPYPTEAEIAELAPHVEALFGALAEREAESGSMAGEPRRRYRSSQMTGMSLFDWADENERRQRRVAEADEQTAAAEEANGAIDAYAMAYKEYVEDTARLEKELAETGASEEEAAAIREQLESGEDIAAEARERLREALKEYYVRENTPDDAERIARDMVGRVEAEVDVRLHKEQILRDILDKDAPIRESADATEAEDRLVKTGGGLISYNAVGHLPDAREGEFAYVERQFSRSGAFSFTGNEVIKDRGDVAYIFRSLESYAVEHVFAVFVKDGRARILHIGMGGPAASYADMGAIRAGYDAFGADEIYLVHNHPSGTMSASPQDRNLMRTLEKAFGEKVKTTGIIMDTTSGRYVTFDSDWLSKISERPREGGEAAAEVLEFDRTEAREMPEAPTVIRGSQDVTRFVTAQRLGGGKKVSYLVVSNSGAVTGNFHTDYETLDATGLAEEIVSTATRYGGTRVVVYGNVKTGSAATWLQKAVTQMSLRSIELLDAVEVRNGHGLSARDEGYMAEAPTEYGAEAREGEDGYLYRTSREIDAEYPNWLDGTTTESGRHSTQVEGTRKTYAKVGDWIEKHLGKGVTILDASSGMGYGTADLRERGFDIEDVEPYQSERRKAENPATYDSYSKIDKQYDYIISNAVLNVIPDDWRRDVLHDMAGRLKEGGRLFINTRKAGEEKSIKDKVELDSPREVLVKRGGRISSYQRFFTPAELKAWVESELGEGYGVEVANEGNSGTKGLAAVVVTKGAEREGEADTTEREETARRVGELAHKLGLNNVDVVTDVTTLSGTRARAKGFYNKETGRITIVLPNNVSAVDAEQTLLHEAVAHYGLRVLFGKGFDDFLSNVYEQAEPDVRHRITELAAREGWDFRRATEEYLAGLAEDTDFEGAKRSGWWSVVKGLFLDMVEELGFKGFRDSRGVLLSDNELRYILWRSYENLKNGGGGGGMLAEAEDVARQAELGVGNYAEGGIEAEYTDNGDLYRPGDFTPRDQALARREYERMVSSGSYQFKEAVQDSMLGLKKLYEAIEGGTKVPSQSKGFRIEDVAGFENAYLFENRMSSMNAGEQHEYFQRHMEPLLKEIAKIAGADKRKRRELTDYLMAKHGLERNAYMRNEAAANDEETDRDFAGLTGLTGETDWQSAEATAQQWVDAYEASHDTAELWQAVNAATKATLETVYLSGIISKETYEKILGMYRYYIPLRGWDETTSEQVYGYLTSKDGPLGGSIMKKAEGRSSMADDPIATIGMMADDAIRQGNRNLMKQRFLNFVLNHPSDAVSVHDIWFEYDDVADEWRPVFADVEATDTADEVAQKVEAFEQHMEALRNAEPDKYKKGSEAQHIPYKVVKGNLKEHQVLIKRNGRTYVATINGNPRAAQALNGLTNPDVDQNGVVGNMLKAGTWINRQLSAFYTTRNPDFVVSNFFRDALYSNCMTWVKESPRYARRFHKNFGRVNPVVMRQLLGKWENGKLDMNNRIEALFYQFMKNGGETGYTNVRDIEGHKRAVAAELKKQGSTGRRVWSALGMQLDLLNRSAENCARFAAFVTSREFGRSMDRSIYDAKEVSVNFNKKGSGGKMVNAVGQTVLGKAGAYLGGGARLLYVFWNAGIQGFTNFGRQAKLHPAKFTAGASTLFALGYVIPMLAQMLGGGDGDDDDKNAYYNLPEYIRRSNICFRAGEQWITIPLPIEYRAMYGIGELAHGVISGNERYTNAELGRQMAAQVSQIFPLDMLEGGGGISPFIPSAAKPFTEAYIMNKGWTGLPVYKDTPFNKNDPEWTKAYASADKHLVAFAKWLNETTGGDDYKKGSIDINPAKIEYLLNGTFGGLFTFPNKIKKTGETMFGDRDFEWRNTPIANRLIKSGDERTAYRKLQNEYFKYKEEYEATGQLMRKYENADEDGIMGYAERINFLENSPEYARWEIFDEFKPDIDAYREDIAEETNKEERAKLEAEMYAVMRELVNALHDPEAYMNSKRQ